MPHRPTRRLPCPAYFAQPLDAGLQARRAGPQLTVLLIQLLQPVDRTQLGYATLALPPHLTWLETPPTK